MKKFPELTPAGVVLALLALVVASSPATAQRGSAHSTARPIGVGIARHPVDLAVERLSTEVRITVDGAQRVARVEVEELFRNNAHRLMEGDYLYPIPAGAVFTDLSLFVGEQELKGEMLPASTARGIYEEIVRRKKDPALVELVGHGLLRARVFPIAPGETRRVILRYTQVLGRDGHLVRLRYPRLVGLFDGGEEGPVPLSVGDERISSPVVRPTTEQHAHVVPAYSIAIRVTGASRFATPYSPTHRIEVREPRGGELEIAYDGGGEAPRDFELFLPLREETVGASVVSHSPGGEAGFYMLLVSPPSVVEKSSIPRDLTLVLDVSGSMSGDKIAQARAALDQMLGGLQPADRFRVITFSSAIRQFRRGFTAAEQDALLEARQWLAGVEADGSTNIQAALQEALSPAASPERMAQVVFLTDGKPTVGETSVESIVELASAQIDDERLFAFGVGYDVNTYLLDSLADGGRGTVSYVGPAEDVEEAVSSLARKISYPALANLRIVEVPVMLEDSYPQELPDLFFGEDLVLFGRYRGNGTGALVLEGTRAGEVERLRFEVEFSAADQGNGFIPKLWAARKAGVLTTQVRLHGANSELIEEIRELGLRYGILTEYTSYLVEEPGMSLDDATLREIMGRAERTGVAAEAQVGAVAFQRADRDQKAARANSVEEAERALRSLIVRPAEPAPATAGDRGGAQQPEGPGFDGRGDVLEGATRHLVDRLFVARGGVWTDLRFSDERVVKIAPYTSAYFELIERLPRIKPFFALGDRVIIAGDGLAIELVDDGASSWAGDELDAVVRAFGS